MDWLRRNWPDLLIGIALVAVIAGIIATLITGGSFFSIGQPQRSVPQVTTPAPTTTPDSVAPVVPEVPAPQVEQPSATPTDGTEPVDDQGPTVAVLPPSTGAGPTTTGEPEAVATPVAPVPQVVAPEVSTPSDATPAPPAPAAVVVEPPEPSSDTDAPFRVSVGAFSSVENAERQADIFRNAGFPVLIGSQGELSLVLVGPFDTRAEAEAAAGRVQAAGLFENPLIYTFTPEDGTAAAPTAAPETAPPAPAAVAAGPAPATAGRYLQVGAYGSTDSAEPQRQRLASLGFAVTDRLESDLVKLLIGPFSDAELAAAQARLDAEGIESFVR